jgi:hypothetical protein
LIIKLSGFLFLMKLHLLFLGLFSTERGGQVIAMVSPNDMALVKAIVAHSAVKWSEGEADDTQVAEILVQVNSVRAEGEIELGEKDRAGREG